MRRFATTFFVLLLVVSVHQLWDYFELRRLMAEIEAIRASGEPVTERDALGHDLPLPSEDPSAASYYLAAAALALSTSPGRASGPLREALSAPRPDRGAIHELTQRLQPVIENGRDALALADRAAGLSFRGFPAGTVYNYRSAALGTLSALITARTLTLSESGDGDAAVDSVISGLQLRRALRDTRWLQVDDLQIAAVLSLSKPSPQALMRLQTALDVDDMPAQSLDRLLRARAAYIEPLWHRYYGTDPTAPRAYTLPMASFTETLARPWLTHNLVMTLRLWAELVAIAKIPWPEKEHRATAVLDAPGRGTFDSMFGTPLNALASRDWPFAAFAQAVDPTPLIVDRCSRVAVAIERFRTAQKALPSTLEDLKPEYLSSVPADPFSGRSLLFRRDREAYVVYSVGVDQRDDGGTLISSSHRAFIAGPQRQAVQRGDVGIRVLIQR